MSGLRCADWNCEAMPRDFPDLIDPWKAADGKRTFQGTMPLRRMKRLASLLVADEGSAQFHARFSYDEQKNVVLDLSVSAELKLICQRSLEPYHEPVERNSRLLVIENSGQYSDKNPDKKSDKKSGGSLAEQDLMQGSYDPILVENHRLALLEAVEDELLLGIPQVPVNPAVKEVEWSTDGAAGKASALKEEPLQRPFAGLAGMLKKKGET
jgi:uncharacterized protein